MEMSKITAGSPLIEAGRDDRLSPASGLFVVVGISAALWGLIALAVFGA